MISMVLAWRKPTLVHNSFDMRIDRPYFSGSAHMEGIWSQC
jgi:hypothetical protein